ncbi:MAG: SUF system Fe-S cluster assembly regulator [Dongiaceae bacterium]
MIKLSRLADYGVVLAGRMALRPTLFHNAMELAEGSGLPTPTVSKILAALAREGVLVSQRGVKGGYRLARAPEAISVAEIIAALDGPIALTMCIEHGNGACDVEAICPSRRGWTRVNDAVRAALESVSLAEMAGTAPLSVPPRELVPELLPEHAAGLLATA